MRPDDDPPSESEDETEADNNDLEHVFALYHCRHIDEVVPESGPAQRGYPFRYAFQIADAEIKRFSVRIDSDDPEGPKCSCHNSGVCRHINWLLEQLSRAGVDVTPTPNFYGRISHAGLGRICRSLDWELREGTGSDSEAESEETEWEIKKDHRPARHGLKTRSVVRERTREIRDILATLSTQPTDDYRRDIFEGADDITAADLLVPNDLGATMSRLLVQDDDLFYRFRTLVPPNTRASDYFSKMERRAKEACDLLDEYAQHGPAAGQQQQHDLIWCAQELVNVVNSIAENVAGRQPLGPSSRREAAKALVSILEEVVRNRNTDFWGDERIARRRKHAERNTDRNLYLRLIGSTSPQNPVGASFVLTALQDLPEAKDFVEDLEAILDLLGEVAWGPDEPATKAYRAKLTQLITLLKGGVGPSPSGIGGKRHAGSTDPGRNVKRMK